MSVLSWNIRGLGSESKSSWCRKLKAENEIGFILIQETQFESLERVNVNRFWGRGDMEFEHVDASGRSGGLISMWNPRLFVKESVVKDRNFLVVSGYLKEDGRRITLINVYCPQRLNDKCVVWEQLKSIITEDGGFWIVGGDFNSVRDSVERRNSNFNRLDSEAFNEFIEDAGLV
ncbi:uncharacterized protein LOC110924504 [Helianthus annuus]|uniref:uncharacterized protein LOC110924504 n=1 Tax=Helianthus annuus TaxID=4232 RepID=UPI000B8F67E4|nr:uncharacterized protein LOC110924504 [Helianthus annuus]